MPVGVGQASATAPHTATDGYATVAEVPVPFALANAPPAADKKRGYHCPPSTDLGAPAWCRAHGLPEPLPLGEAAKFLDHWCDVAPHLKGTKSAVGWQAAWRNWVAKAGSNGHHRAMQAELSEVEKAELRKQARANNG